MNDLINTIFERLNSPKPIFNEKVTKTNLIPVVEELNDDDLENIVYEITNADYFDDMTWILYSTNLDKKYPKTLHFLTTMTSLNVSRIVSVSKTKGTNLWQ